MKDALNTLGTYIHDAMQTSELSRQDVRTLAELAEDFNELCEFVKNFGTHKDGTLYEPSTAGNPNDSNVMRNFSLNIPASTNGKPQRR